MFSIRATAAAATFAALAIVAGTTVPATAAVRATRTAPSTIRSSAASSFKVLHTFGGLDGSTPQGELDLALQYDGHGGFTRTIYGTTLAGGSTSEGVIYSDVIESNVFTTLRSMSALSQGSSPTGGVASNATDYFYGGFQLGVNNSGGAALFGTVFALSAAGGVMVVHAFSGGPDGGNPVGRITQFVDGNYYGTTSSGADGYGTIFRVKPSGQFSTVYTFKGALDGGSPAAGLSPRVNLFSRTGAATKNTSVKSPLERVRAYRDVHFVSPYLYGTTSGANGSAGTIFAFNPVTNQVQTIHTFSGGNDGASPVAELSSDFSGDLFGTASGGGAKGDGVVFELTEENKLITLHAFAGSDGATPLAPVTVGFDGDLYGTTSMGGANNAGNVFRLKDIDETFSVLHDFTGGADGANPAGKLLDGLDGNVYGTTQNGGSNGMGVLFTVPG